MTLLVAGVAGDFRRTSGGGVAKLIAVLAVAQSTLTQVLIVLLLAVLR